jgi:hypothetical protein
MEDTMSTDETTTIRPSEQNQDSLASPSRTRRLLAGASSLTARGRAAAPAKVRRAGQATSDHWMPVAAGAVAVAGATTLLILRLRRAAESRAARNRRRPGFLKR